MDLSAQSIDKTYNHTRYRRQAEGHYESFFLRANHPTSALAFWIRYTLFSPRGAPDRAVGELWAVVFDGETGRHVALKQALPLKQCDFSTAALQVRIGAATLAPGKLIGALESGEHRLAWQLSFEGEAPPLFLLPPAKYASKFPAAKALVGLPNARFAGALEVDGRSIDATGWRGSQNHNWGPRHTDLYAWGQVAGFETHPESFLEVATARLRLGWLWTPPFTPMVLRHRGREYALRSIPRSLRARGAFNYFTWRFASEDAEVAIAGSIHARARDFVGLRYANPPGGTKHCLNTKIAACELVLRDKTRGIEETLLSPHGAAFEILTDDSAHGIPLAA